MGPGNVERDRFDYNRAIGETNNEQMLLNLVRMRYRDVPVFMAVSSVLTQYVYSGSFGLNGVTGRGAGADADSFGGSATVRYTERPTISYAPMTGPEFASQLMTPIPAELVFTLMAAGWPAGELLQMSLERVNGVRNGPFRDSGGSDKSYASPDFERMVELIVEMAGTEALEYQKDPDTGAGVLVIVDGLGDEADASIAAFRSLVGLDPAVSRYRVVQRRVQRADDEITVRVRSLLALMGALSRRVEIPPAHLDQRLVGEDTSFNEASSQERALRIQSADERPTNAYVAVEYLGKWFYLENTDERSREAFGLVTYLYLMMATQPESAGPILTVPAG